MSPSLLDNEETETEGWIYRSWAYIWEFNGRPRRAQSRSHKRKLSPKVYDIQAQQFFPRKHRPLGAATFETQQKRKRGPNSVTKKSTAHEPPRQPIRLPHHSCHLPVHHTILKITTRQRSSSPPPRLISSIHFPPSFSIFQNFENPPGPEKKLLLLIYLTPSTPRRFQFFFFFFFYTP